MPDVRPRNPVGQFAPEGGTSSAAMRLAYAMRRHLPPKRYTKPGFVPSVVASPPSGVKLSYRAKRGPFGYDLSANLQALDDRLTEFVGGYIRTEDGVLKEKGVGAHFTRNAGTYIGSIAAPLGTAVGLLVDHSRTKNNKIKTASEPVQPASLARLSRKQRELKAKAARVAETTGKEWTPEQRKAFADRVAKFSNTVK